MLQTDSAPQEMLPLRQLAMTIMCAVAIVAVRWHRFLSLNVRVDWAARRQLIQDGWSRLQPSDQVACREALQGSCFTGPARRCSGAWWSTQVYKVPAHSKDLTNTCYLKDIKDILKIYLSKA